MRRGFTLLELLVIVAILGIMVTAGVVSLTSGQGAARVRGSARNIVATIRHARSVALVSQQPATITFSNESSADGDTVARVIINSVRIINTNVVTQAMTVEGKTVNLFDEPDAPKKEKRIRSHTVNGEDAVVEDSSGGEDIADILFAPVSEEVVRGIRLKVVTGEEAEESFDVSTPVRYKSRVSVFSTADYINSKYQEKTAKEAAEKAAKAAEENVLEVAAGEEKSEPVSIVWEVNGRTEPHCVWVYPDGSTPEKGLLIRVDRFGGVKVLRGDGQEDDEE